MNFADINQRVVDVDITVAEGIITVRGLLNCVSVSMIEFTKVNGEVVCLDLADEDLCDKSVQGFRIITDEDDIMEFIVDYNQTVADSKIAEVAKLMSATYKEICQHLPIDKQMMLDMLDDKFEFVNA